MNETTFRSLPSQTQNSREWNGLVRSATGALPACQAGGAFTSWVAVRGSGASWYGKPCPVTGFLFILSLVEEEAYVRQMSAVSNALFLVEDVSGEMAGVPTLRAGSRERMQHLGELGLSVRRKYWRQGFGSALLNTLIRWSPGAGVTKVALCVKDQYYGPALHGTRAAAGWNAIR